MDHLPHIPGVSVRYKVPYIGKDVYDMKGFSGYPIRMGWKIEGNGSFTPKDDGKFASFLQTWLFFGLLAEFLGPDMKTTDFICKGPNEKQYITTENLEVRLQAWRGHEKDRMREVQNRHMISVGFALDEARIYVSRFCSLTNVEKNSLWPVDSAISLSFMVLGEALTQARSKILGKFGAKMGGWYADFNEGRGHSKMIMQRMKPPQWCPHSVYMLQGLMRGHVSGLYYASFLRYPDEKNDGNCSSPRDPDKDNYGNCSECKGETIKMLYKTKYARSGCVGAANCKILGPETRKLVNIIQNGGIPLLTYSEGKVNVRQFQEHTSYVIISHVWADGLGNSGANKLPECQLRHLNAIFQELNMSRNSTETPFWIDTLTIPVGPEHRLARGLAIRNMHRTYSLADKTVVLDAKLMSNNGKGKGYTETAMRVTISGWMRRLWTLQEGVLSKSLYFKFRDGLVELEELEATFPEANSSLQSNVPEAARAYYHAMLRSERQQKNSCKDLVAPVWKTAQWRTTSHLKNETIAIATLLNIDPKPLLQTPYLDRDLDLRMKILLSSLGDLGAIPPGMIFLPGPRLNQQGFGWAPKTWMAGHKVDHPDPLTLIGPIAHLTPRGLMVRYPGFILRSLNKEAWQLGRTLSTESSAQAGRCIFDKFSFPTNKLLLEWYVVGKDADIDESGPNLPSEQALNRMELALILPRHNHTAIPEIAILVAISERRDEIMYVEILSRVWVSVEMSWDVIQKWQGDFKKSDIDGWGEVLGSDQQWCVDGGGWERALANNQQSVDSDNVVKSFGPNSPFMEFLLQRSAEQSQVVISKFGLNSGYLRGLTKLGLYEFIILCDDSASMAGSRMRVLQKTLQCMAEFVTIMNPEGISLRFINYDGDENGNFDYLTAEMIHEEILAIELGGPTRLGTALQKKIVLPMIAQKVIDHEFKRPVFVVIITDGSPAGEQQDTLRNTILSCKRSLEEEGYGNAAVVFLITRIGDDLEARRFLEILGHDREIQAMVQSVDLNEIWTTFQDNPDNTAYIAWLIELFLTVL